MSTSLPISLVVDRSIKLLGLRFVKTPDRLGLSFTLHVDKIESVVDNPDTFG